MTDADRLDYLELAFSTATAQLNKLRAKYLRHVAITNAARTLVEIVESNGRDMFETFEGDRGDNWREEYSKLCPDENAATLALKAAFEKLNELDE